MRMKPCPFILLDNNGSAGNGDESTEPDPDAGSSSEPAGSVVGSGVADDDGTAAPTCRDYEQRIEYYVGSEQQLPQGATIRLCQINNKILFQNSNQRVYAVTPDPQFLIGYVPQSEARTLYLSTLQNIDWLRNELPSRSSWRATYNLRDIYIIPDGSVVWVRYHPLNPGKPI